MVDKTEFDGWDTDKLMDTTEKLETKLASILKKSKKEKEFWNLLEMERELIIREFFTE